jgi:serine/threonine protein kinase/CRP-like cAMP-binding protein
MQAGETFGKYRVLERIAVGGMAEVLLAETDFSGINKHCAIKRILESYSQDLQFVSMFIDEARITIGLEHPNIVRLYDFGQHEGTYFMAMEYVDGTDLACVLRKIFAAGDAVPANIAAFVARELLRGLGHAHTKKDHEGRPLGIVHRDISPQNVLLSARGEVKLTDFGIAAARNKLTLTNPGTVLGKSAYMSPEHARGEIVNARADLWATGVILWEMLTGDRLFAAETPVATIARVMNHQVMPPSESRDGISPELDQIALRALKRDVRKRFQSADEMADALDAYLQKEPCSASLVGVFLAKLDLAEDQRHTFRPEHTRRLDVSPDATTLVGADASTFALVEKFKEDPDLWRLVDIGDALHAKAPKRALAAYRCAAAVFAYRGLLIQSIVAYHHAMKLISDDQAYDDLVALGDVETSKRDELMDLVKRFDAWEFWELLCQVDPSDLGSEVDREPLDKKPTPLFGHLAPREFAQLAQAVRVRTAKVGEVILVEGEWSKSLFALAHGRVVVHCKAAALDRELDFGDPVEMTAVDDLVGLPVTPAELRRNDRVYLSALADGDFFGEFSFLMERPRSASVEAITDCTFLEISRDMVKRFRENEPGFTSPLVQFYKERVVELMMAKSPVFSRVSPGDRRELLDRAEIIEFSDEDIIIEQGAESDSMYFIRRGEVEIYREDESGVPIFINKLGQGQFFGEISALRGTPRTNSVRAMGQLTAFRFPREDIVQLVERQPELRTIFERTIQARRAEADERIEEHARIFYGV